MRDDPTVYSTEHGRHCPKCNRPLADCICTRASARLAGDGIVRILRDSKGRKGKTVTLVTGLPLNDAEMAKMAVDLKRHCGAGGAVKNGVIEIQGDHRDIVLEILQKKGIKVKLAGG